LAATPHKACELAHIARSSYRYRPGREKDHKPKEQLRKLAEDQTRYGDGHDLPPNVGPNRQGTHHPSVGQAVVNEIQKPWRLMRGPDFLSPAPE